MFSKQKLAQKWNLSLPDRRDDNLQITERKALEGYIQCLQEGCNVPLQGGKPWKYK